MRHPIQVLEIDTGGVLRFRENKLVRYLLDKGNISMNDLAVVDFPREDREQFAQLIGYSLSGYGELSYVSDHSYDVAAETAKSDQNEKDLRIKDLEDRLHSLKEGIRLPIAQLFEIHPDDLLENL